MMLIGFALNFIFTVSCNDQPTYEELKAAEKKIINRILNDNKIEVLTEYPKSGVFGENQFVLLSSGIYLNVVDSGSGKRAVLNETVVLVRTKGTFYFQKVDSIDEFNTFSGVYSPFEFKYGHASTVFEEHRYMFDDYYRYFGVGFESVLEYVGDSAIVKMIVPGYSEIKMGNSSIAAGSSYQNGDGYSFIPVYYDRVRYLFY